MKKIISKIKLFSSIIFPVTILGAFQMPYLKNFISITSDKTNSLAGCSSTLIGFLITILTLYISFPEKGTIIRRMKNSGHDKILLSNMAVGISLYIASLLTWLLTNKNYLSAILFLCAISNTLIIIYYVVVIVVVVRYFGK